MSIERVDPTNDEAFLEWFGVLQRSELHRNGGEGSGWQPDEWRARAIDADAPSVIHLFAKRHEGRVVAVAGATVTRDDNLHSLRADLFVEPTERRKGFGTELLQFVEHYSRDLGRNEVTFWVIEGPGEIGTSTCRYFAPAQGYALVDEMARRDIAWPPSFDVLEDQAATWAPYATEYEFHSWYRHAPDDLTAKLADLMSRMGVEANFAEVEVEQEVWDVDRVRHHEQMIFDMGRDLLVVAATHKQTGELAGYTELTVSRNDPSTAYQWDTLVARAHRGHRLGGLMKIENLRQFAARNYATQRIYTSNSIRNTPMIDVNVALGAQIAGATAIWLKQL